MNGFLGEFFGTMILIVLGVGTGAGVNLKTSYARNSGWLFITIAWGMAVTFGVYVAGSFGSQGHLNPAVKKAIMNKSLVDIGGLKELLAKGRFDLYH